MNKNISVWRGSDTPPTNYHLWVNGNIIKHYVDGAWETIVDPKQVEDLKQYVNTTVDNIKIETTEDVIVAGGPLADDITDNWPDSWKQGDNKVIPAGTSLQDIISGLFLKTINGTVSWGSKTWNPTLGKPSVSLSKTGTVEVGTSVSATVATNSTVSNNVRSCTCTASQGHFTSLDGTYISGNKTVSATGTSSGTPSVVNKWNNTTVSSTSALKVVKGTNTFSTTQSGIKAAVKALPTTTVYASTNTKKILPNVSATLTDTKPTDKDLTSSNSATVTGAYYYFIGECNAITDITSDLVRSLSKKAAMTTSQISYTVAHNPGKGFIVACPATNKIDYIKDDAAVFEGGFSLKTMNVQDAGGTNVSYNVYYCNNSGSNKATYKFFKFK